MRFFKTSKTKITYLLSKTGNSSLRREDDYNKKARFHAIMFLPTELSLNVFIPLESWVHTQTIYALMSRNEYISVENVHFLPIDHIYLTKH